MKTLNRGETIGWIISLCAQNLRLSQAKTLAALVASAMGCQRISLANLGRNMLGTVKHQIKRCWRFCSNDRIKPADAMKGVVAKLLKKRKKPLLIALDWVDIKGFQTLMASGIFKGRSIPLYWASCKDYLYGSLQSRNSFEESLLLALRRMIPQGQKVIILADRGFGRTELGRFCQHYGFDYVIRINPKVMIQCPSYNDGKSFKLAAYPVYKGICKLLSHVSYRSHHPVKQHIVVRWVRGLPVKRDECWYLMSNLKQGPARLSHLYGKRMTIEQLFRDHKSKRNGWSLRDTGIKSPDRLDRMILILALAYLMLCGVGLLAKAVGHPGQWCSSTAMTACSVFVIGQVMLHRFKCSAAQAFAAIFKATEIEAPNWG